MLFQADEPLTLEKLYLHTDREFYFLGETIWFKAYLLDGQSFSPVTDIQNLYIDLIDSKGRISQNQVLLYENGDASGSILIPDTSLTGTFMIRAYTDYLKNFGEETYFHKALQISKVMSSLDLESDKPVFHEGKHELGISFFPEGGYLLADTKNLIAFKAIDENGKGIPINGKVLDNNGETISLFKTYYNGMGRMHLLPVEGKSYNVEIDGYPDFEYTFNDILKEGVKLQFLGQTNEELTFGLVSNSSEYSGQPFFMACFSRNKLLFYKTIEGSLLPMKVTIETDLLQVGINRFILLNEDLVPVSERMVFYDNINVNYLEIKPSHEEYATRSLVQIDILDEIDNLGNSPEKTAVKIEYPKTAGISIRGRAEKIYGKKSIFNGPITLGVFEDNNINWFEGKTDSTGRFSFDNICFFDTATIFVQALNERGKQKSEIYLDPVLEKEPAVSPYVLNLMEGFQDIPFQLYRQKYYSDLALREFSPDHATILLEEVEITAKIVEKDDGHVRLYNTADQVLEVTHIDNSYIDVLEYLQGRVAGLSITGNNVFFLRSTSSLSRTPTPLFLIDGFPTGGSKLMTDDAIMDDNILSLVRSIPMTQIDKVEILKGNSAAIYGTRAANGVIAIYTRKGLDSEMIVDPLVGAITKRIVGFSRYREFYSPEYTPENIDSPKPDYRTTLYWDPNITTENGKAVLNFFTSDDFSYFRVIVEGIMDNGSICLGSAKFAVNKRNESLVD